MATGHGKLQCDIITPERPLFSGTCDRVVAPAHDGKRGVLPGHASFITELGVGLAEVRVEDETGKLQTQRFAVREGFLQVSDNQVTLLAVDACTRDEAKQESDLAKQAEVMRETAGERRSDEEQRKFQRERQWVEARRTLHDEEEF